MKFQNNFSPELLFQFLRRLHAFIGVFIGPFIIVASFTGALYGVFFAFENTIYKNILFVENSASPKTLSMQIQKTNAVVGDSGKLLAVRPASGPTDTTRVLYTSEDSRSSEYRTIFINPSSLNVTGDLITYGSSGAMPLRHTMDLLHRDLLLGDFGRWYSELAASWLWITGFTGLILFFRRNKTKLDKSKNHYQKLITKHVYLGLFCLIGLVMLSITGLTWSNLAGDNISKIRSGMNWNTPSINRNLETADMAHDEHSEHELNHATVTDPGYDLAMFDTIRDVARSNGIDATKIEIRPATKTNEAWLVSEIDRSFPSQVDSVAVNPKTLAVTDKSDFSTFPLMAKLTRWGIDIHMGSLFGIVNQILLVVIALAISILGMTGYWIWIKRCGWKNTVKNKSTLLNELKSQTPSNLIILIPLLLIVGIVLPVFLMSLIGFMIIEEIICLNKKRPG